MRLTTAVQRYVDYKQELGMKFFAENYIFSAFCRSTGDVDVGRVSPSKVWAFLCPNGQQTRVSDMAWSLLEHSGEHYGQLVVYYRIAGLVPPESRPKK